LAGLPVKNMRHKSFLGPGRQAVLSPVTGVSDVGAPGRGALAARPILRKPSRTSS
jgi:hypothetical protein